MNKKNLHAFDRDLEMFDTGSRVFALTLSDQWNIAGSTLNGGYLMGVIAKAMELCSPKKATPIITANYISKCVPGKALAHVEVVSESANFTRFMVRLVQQGKEKIRALGTFSSNVNGDAVQEYETGPPVMADFEDSFQVPVMPDNALFDHIDLRLDPSCAGWLSGGLSERSEFKGWVCFKKERKIDIPAILLFSDTWPPPVFARFGPSAWVPTIELSVNVRKVPDTLVLKGIFKSRFISGGLVEEDGELWDARGELVAVSRQIAKYRKTKG